MQLVDITKTEDIFPEYRQTPIELLLEFHNLKRPFETYTHAKLLIGMCMDNRVHLSIPDNFAFMIRSGGANLRYSEFNVSYAIAVGGIQYIALIGHNDCGMVNLESRKELFVNGLSDNAGCDREWAEEHFMQSAPVFETGDETGFLIKEASRLRSRYPNITVVPMLFRIPEGRLYLVGEKSNN